MFKDVSTLFVKFPHVLSDSLTVLSAIGIIFAECMALCTALYLVADWINTLAILALRVYVIWDKSKRIGILLLVLLLVCFLYRTLGLTN